MDTQTDLPGYEQIAKAVPMTVFDANGGKVKFGDLFRERKTIVVFIRHFFCGICQAYVSQLATVNRQVLDEHSVGLVVIGCGQYEPIKAYAENTGFTAGSIYADPERNLFRLFGLIENLGRTPAGVAKKSYLEGQTFLGNMFSSIWKGPVKNPLHIGKQGNISQLGGDFIFGPGETCGFASRMKHTEDHVEVKDLMTKAGVPYP